MLAPLWWRFVVFVSIKIIFFYCLQLGRKLPHENCALLTGLLCCNVRLWIFRFECLVWKIIGCKRLKGSACLVKVKVVLSYNFKLVYICDTSIFCANLIISISKSFLTARHSLHKSHVKLIQAQYGMIICVFVIEQFLNSKFDLIQLDVPSTCLSCYHFKSKLTVVVEWNHQHYLMI